MGANKGDGSIGHHKKLRQRFLVGEAYAFPDNESLELVLFHAQAISEAKRAISHRFLSFLKQTLRGSRGYRSSPASLKTVRPVALFFRAEPLMQLFILWTWEHLIAYFQARMDCGKIGEFCVPYLNRNNPLVGEEIHQRVTVEHTP